ncbi:MAG: helix-turn-helix transcriptional regulator [Flavobacteriales bacterium]|nr:helix-turn-helix transcriptional regulator [Flavobacteriales bacterium]MDG1766733.1 helix-turn-helix transcriptional regulator [Flavobacteriales bacterium]
MGQEHLKATIIKNIKRLREEKGLSQEQMAEALEMSTSGYNNVERGSVDVCVSRVEQIAVLLNVQPAALFEFESSQIFNISQNKYVQGTGARAENMQFSSNEYVQRYIEHLEKEIIELKEEKKSGYN